MLNLFSNLSQRLADEPLVLDLTKLRRIRRGSRVSRLFRLVFEHRKIKKVLGSTLALILVSSTLLPPTSIAAYDIEEQDAVVRVVDQPLITESGTRFPVENPIINQGYHFFHPAIDLEGITGDSVFPVMDGVVKTVQYSRFGLGNTVIIDHGNKVTSVYAHLSQIQVDEGQEVEAQTKIGEVGSTGYSTGDHLHLEIRQGGQALNPLSVLPQLP